ncbi:phenol 2-monooxygenase [Trichodelitschia bisporula]|uniref:Phenol 2-monooxygenase n=1 Tax=Trichodelitschia bisporula TaxID=703511 RepID=A0A6G1HXE2_9PEZI|nr:phenol 2-monooxygenase [Trichodelitschia bisporula]
MSPEALALNPLEDVTHDVVVVGAGPSGLLLALADCAGDRANLVRFGVRVEVVDNRSARTNTGRADGLQPKTIETLKQMRLADRLLLKGVKVFDIHFWRSGKTGKIERVARQPYYSPELDMRDPYLLLAHQGFVEDLFLKDMQERGLEVHRNLSFVDYTHDSGESPIHVLLKSETRPVRLTTRYLVGCDGVHSGVRTAMGARPVGSSYDAVWGVLDGLLETTFPDLYSMVIINHAENGSALLFPREKGMTRLYVELKRELRNGPSKKEFSREMVMARAAEIFEPYSIRWKHVEWFGLYQVGQKIASAFQDTNAKVFIAGDACHSQSPKASQGMNHSMHDSWNLAWKLNLAVRGLAKPALLASYDLERRQVADRLITFDFEHASTFVAGDMQALSANFRKNIKFISGYGAEYAPNALCVPQTQGEVRGLLRAGELPVPARVLRAFDRNPVDLQLDIPVLGQFRIFVFAPSPITPRPFLQALSSHMLSFNSPMGKLTCAANASYTTLPPLAAPSDEFIRPERYTTISGLFTFALVIPPQGEEFDVKDLPAAWRDSAFTVYFDDEAGSAAEKWLGGVEKGEVAVVVLRPDGYVGTVGRFDSRGCGIMEGKKAGEWLDEYFDGELAFVVQDSC